MHYIHSGYWATWGNLGQHEKTTLASYLSVLLAMPSMYNGGGRTSTLLVCNLVKLFHVAVHMGEELLSKQLWKKL